MSIDLENPGKSLAACAALDAEIVSKLPDEFSSDMITSQPDRLIFDAVVDLTSSGSGAGLPEICGHLERAGTLENVGGGLYLADLVDCVPHTIHANTYANKLIDSHTRSKIHSAGMTMRAAADDPTQATADIVADAERAVFGLADTGQQVRPQLISEIMPDVLQIIEDRIKSDGPVTGLATGFEKFDTFTCGLRPSNLIVLGAPTSAGKTAFACNVAHNVSRAGGVVLFFSLEMSNEELTERVLVLESDVPSHLLQSGNLDREQRDRVMEAANKLNSSNLIIDMKADRTISQISGIARRYHRKQPLDLIIVDYVQLVRPEDRKAPREQQVAEISRRLQVLAKELKVPVIALAQLNRDLYKRDDKRPVISDLRESSALAQDADLVMFIHRPEIHDVDDRAGEADLLLRKNRGGAIGDIKLRWKKELMKFNDFDSEIDF